jgi:chemotaxis protein methyltransferase CheR
MEAIYLRYGYDFRDYAGASQKRRVLQAQQRMPDHLRAAGTGAARPGDIRQLLQYLTMPVSEMFRDPYFLALRQQVVPRCAPMRRSRSGSPAAARAKRCIRWRSCCARKACSTAPSSMRPTSTMSRWTRRARGSSRWKACRPHQKLPEGRRQTRFSDYYTAAYNGAVFDKSLRDNITFADHSLATDACSRKRSWCPAATC